MTKVLVTGGAGFIGSHVVDLLISRGFDVVVLDNLSTGKKENLNPSAELLLEDIRDWDIRRSFARIAPDYVIHHAAQMNVRTSMRSPSFDADVNIMGTLNLIRTSLDYNVKHFVYISSSAVYGQPLFLPVKEGDEIAPVCHYGVSKHTIEHYLQVFHQVNGLSYTVFRYPNVYGPRQDPHGEAGVIAQLSGKILQKQPIIINGDGEQTRDFVHVRDIAMANYYAILKNHPGGIYNLGSKQPTSINQIVRILKRTSRQPIEPSYGPEIAGETKHIYLDPTRALRHLGWNFEIPIEQGIRETFAYLKESLGK